MAENDRTVVVYIRLLIKIDFLMVLIVRERDAPVI